MNPTSNVIVVGGGLSGLAAAAAAARAGARVEVLEAHNALGGRAQTDDVDGYALLLGPHAFYGGGPGERVLDALRVRPKGRRPSLRHHRILRDGQLERAPYDVGGLRRIAALRSLPRAALARPAEHTDTSAAEWIAATAPPGPARELLTVLVRTATYTVALDELPASIAIDQTRRSLWPGVRYLDWGWQPMVDALADAALAAGAVVRTRAKAATVLPGGAGVRLAGGEEVHGDVVVLAGLSPGGVARLLEPTGATVPIPAKGARPVEAACLDLALDRLPRPDQRFVLGADTPLFLSEVTRATRSAPSGGAVLHAARYLRNAAERPDRAELEGLLDLAQPGWRDRVVHARFLPRMTVVQHMGPRVAADACGLDRVLLAGDWIGEEGWLADAALASGAAAGARAATTAEAAATERGASVRLAGV